MLLLVALIAGGCHAAPTTALGARHGQARIAFYGDILNIIGNENPLLVRPATLLLAEDGSVALIHLKWSGWGSSVARASGVLIASNCNPNCADGKLTKKPAQLTLSNPGLVYGHRVYRCYQISPHGLQSGPFDHGCIRLDGNIYGHASK